MLWMTVAECEAIVSALYHPVQSFEATFEVYARKFVI